MAQWISIEEAAVKYGFEAEYLWVLIEMRENHSRLPKTRC